MPDCSSVGGDRLVPLPSLESRDGALRTTLTVTTARLCVAAVTFLARTYNGHFPGPTLRVQPGDRVEVTLANRLAPNAPMPGSDAPPATYRASNSTNLHIHGLYQSPQRDNTFIAVDPGEQHVYRYLVHPQTGSALNWYHAHLEGSSGLQLRGGMAGAFVIDPPTPSGVDPLFRGWPEHVVVAQEIDLDPSSANYVGSEAQNGGTSMLRPDVRFPPGGRAPGALLLANGQLSPRIDLAAGAFARLRLINALGCSISLLQLELRRQGAPVGTDAAQGAGGSDAADDTCRMCVLAYDGVFLSEPRCQPHVLLPPGGRIDLAVSCADAGAYDLRTSAGEFGDLYPAGRTLLGIDVHADGGGAASAQSGLPSRLPGPPPFYRDLRAEPPPRRADTFTWVLGNLAGDAVINGRKYDGHFVSHEARVGSVQEWTLQGGEGKGLTKMHPWHQHTSHFQIVGMSREAGGLAGAVGDLRDTVPLYAGLNFTIRFVPSFAGMMMVHCHVLKHEDTGMMALVKVDDGRNHSTDLGAAAGTNLVRTAGIAPGEGGGSTATGPAAWWACGLAAAALAGLVLAGRSWRRRRGSPGGDAELCCAYHRFGA